MEQSISSKVALVLSVGLMLSANARAHTTMGPKLSDAECAAVWKLASPNGDTIPANQAEPYILDFNTNSFILDDGGDGDGNLSAEEFKMGCADGMVKSSQDDVTNRVMEGSDAPVSPAQMKPEREPDRVGESGPR